MIQIHDYLYVGSDADVSEFKDIHPGGYVIHAAKEPWHRGILGYKGRGAPRDQYYYGVSGDDYLALNLVDSPDKKYIAKECFDLAQEVLEKNYNADIPTLLHCNQGKSRSAGILFYHMLQVGIDSFPYGATYDEAVVYFETVVYPDTEFGAGVADVKAFPCEKKCFSERPV